MSRNTYGIHRFKAFSLLCHYIYSFSSFHRLVYVATDSLSNSEDCLSSFLAFMMVLIQFRGNTRKHSRKVAWLYLESGERRKSSYPPTLTPTPPWIPLPSDPIFQSSRSKTKKIFLTTRRIHPASQRRLTEQVQESQRLDGFFLPTLHLSRIWRRGRKKS